AGSTPRAAAGRPALGHGRAAARAAGGAPGGPGESPVTGPGAVAAAPPARVGGPLIAADVIRALPATVRELLARRVGATGAVGH
ncbi:MAG TPA: hypothetical protein VI248_28230, partial [Kineosporiaceae bacterium]